MTPEYIPLPGRAGDPGFHLCTYQLGAGPAVVFCHGFPDLALGWRHQLRAVADAGFRAFAPDMRGYRGGINWYRNIDGNAQAHPDVGVRPLAIPCLMLMAELDPALRPEFAADMPERCSNLEMHLIKNAGHWVQQEQPTEFNALLVDWLRRVSMSMTKL